MCQKNMIAFITCVNDEEEYAECQYYLNRFQMDTKRILSV